MNRAVLLAGAVGFAAGYLGNFVLDAWVSRHMAAPPRSCCGGSGFADYAAVPCPDPECPHVAEQWRLYGLMAGGVR